ncbi:cyclodeaminase/cyclohydrolase family protein [Bacillota bacterium LX-D]|nr:cyclodeaminase/cyclohydrolase family protein [Bacillota bacterium LX-D]
MNRDKLLGNSVEHFVQLVALPKAATPGAGSTSAVVAALAASLLELVALLAERANRQKSLAREVIFEAHALRLKLLELVEDDNEALKNLINSGYKSIPVEALNIPQLIILYSLKVCRLANKARYLETKTSAGDTLVAGQLAKSAVLAAIEVLRQNSKKLKDKCEQKQLLQQATLWEKELDAIFTTYDLLQ